MTDKERLEEIVEYEHTVPSGKHYVRFKSENDYKQLIQQAERVEELEEREKIYKEIIQSYGKIADGFVDDIERLVKRNERYKQALEFYADKKNHEREWDTFTDSGVEKSEVMKDGGELARQALKGETK